jgi:phosphoesterase RecJ-like protein
MLGLGRILEKQWKDISYFTPSAPSKMFGFLNWFEKITDNFDYGYYNLLIFLDFSNYSRLGKLIKMKNIDNNETIDKTHYFEENDIIIFDHHEWNVDPKNRTTLKDTNATSTCEIIFENTINIREEHFDTEVATYLYLWLTTDSGNFRYDENHERILKNALELIKLWADKKLIIDNFINNKSMGTIQFLKVLLDRLKQDWEILYTYYDTEELSNFDIDGEQAGYWLTIIQEIKWPKVIMTIRKKDDIIKCSLRSKDTNVEQIF